MSIVSKGVQKQALEAIKADTAGMWWVYQRVQLHSKTGMLVLGIVPLMSMFVVESYQSLVSMFPRLRCVLSQRHADLLHSSRHRAKLLDDSTQSIDEVIGELATIICQHRKRYLEPHTGMLGLIKRLIQPDLGLYTYEGHIFSTTHATSFGFGSNVDPGAVASSFGESMGAYLISVIDLLRPHGIIQLGLPALSKDIEMRDIKHEALYQRGPLGDIRMDYAAGLTLVLSSLNYVHHIVRRMLPAKSLAFFRFKFLTAYHADSSLRTVQDRIMGGGRPSEETQQVFRLALGNFDSRWLRKQGPLRNLLTHYMAEESCAEILGPNVTRVEAIEHLSGDRTYDEIDDLLDRHIEHLCDTLEKGFQLSGDPFWYGKVT